MSDNRRMTVSNELGRMWQGADFQKVLLSTSLKILENLIISVKKSE
jgi:hypothetical protein